MGDDFPAQLPLQLSTVGMAFNYRDEPHFGLHADAEWVTQFPSTRGFIDLGPDNRTFHVSMVHQLHCLDLMRVAFASSRVELAGHYQHCLRYMRKMVLCNADTTLEVGRPALVDGQWIYVANMSGSVHRCKDWTMLRRYLEDHPPHHPGPM